VLDSLAPGTIGFEVHQEIGEPLNGMNAIQERYAAPDKGVAEAECWYDNLGFIKFSRTRLVNKLPLMAARLLFNVTEGAKTVEGHAIAKNEVEGATTISYTSAGVHMVVIDGIVQEIWRMKSGLTVGELKKAAQHEYSPAKAENTVKAPALVSPDNPGNSGKNLDKPGAIQNPSIEPAAPRRPQGPPRLLQITSTWFEVTGDVMEGQSIRAFAKITSRNLAGEMMKFSVGIRRPGGSSLLAVADAPPAYVGPDGVICSSFQTKVLYPKSAWSKANTALPLKLVDDPAGNFGNYVLIIKSECGGLESISETTCFVTGPGYMQFPKLRKFEIEPASIDTGQMGQFGSGYLLKFPLAIHGCREAQMSGYLELRNADGTRVKATDTWPAFARQDGGLYSLRKDQVRYDLSRWKAYQVYFPRASLPKSERYSVRLILSCDGLQASFDMEHDFEVPMR